MLEGPTEKPTAATRAQDPAVFVNVSDGPLVPVCDSDAAAKEGDVYQPSRKSTYTPPRDLLLRLMGPKIAMAAQSLHSHRTCL